MNRRPVRAAALATCAAVLLGGCDFSIYKMPLPGGADLGDEPYTVTVYFDDVMDLVPQSAVKVSDVTVGKIEDISVQGYTAEVELAIRGDVRLPDNAVAKIRQTSLLGEKFVSLSPPADGTATGRLEDGEEIPLERSGRNPEVEEVLGALSLLLNGGGVAQLKTITQELNNVLAGNEGGIKSLLSQLDEFMGQLDSNKHDIIRAIEALNRLSKSAKEQTSSITQALDRMPRALDSLDKQRDDLIRMLDALGRLSKVGTRVIRASKENTVDSLESLAPILSQLADAGESLPKAMQVFLTYPFVDAVVGTTPAEARNLHQGDFTNLSAKLDVDLQHLLAQQPGLGPKGGSNPADQLQGEIEKNLEDLRNGADGGAGQAENELRRRRRQVEDGLRNNPLGGALGGTRQRSGSDDNTRPRRRQRQGGSGGSGGGSDDDCLLVLCRTGPEYHGNVSTSPADTARLGYDPDVVALLLQGVTVR
ncbi:MAG TPA: MCE family protein [Nocardioidaceae bacterium]|nr:MCE family protein [Nocardioidaceae bacterium]